MVLTFQSATSDRILIPIDLQNIFWRSKTLPKGITSVTGFSHSIGGTKKPVAEKTSNSNGKVVGDSSKPIKRVDVRFSFKGGFASVRERSVTISGSVPWEMTYRVLVRLVPEIKNVKFEITNTAVKFYLKKEVNIEGIYNEKYKTNTYRMEYEPELGFSRLKIKFSDGVVASIFANGTVVAQGRNLTGIETRVKNLLDSYKKPYKGTAVRKIPIPARKNLAKKRKNITEARYERAKNWFNYKNGYYVRPGPDKVPRFYAVPSKPALVRQKVLRAYANIGVNVPPLTRSLLGIAPATTKPKPKAVPKKTLGNWNVSPPNGMYVRPGPGGLPKFYKIPKFIKQGKKTVLDAYKKAGVKIPNKVRTIFGISPSPVFVPGSTSPGTNRTSPITGNINNKGRFRIDRLDCMRYKLEDLKKIAIRLDIPITRRTKDQLCREIRSKIIKPNSKPKVDFVKNGIPHSILINSRKIKRGTRSKTINSFKIEELKNFILKLDASSKVNGKKKKNLIDLLIERKRARNIFNKMFDNFSPGSTNSNSNGSPSSSPSTIRTSPSPARDPLNIARDVLGPGFTNSELREFLNRYVKSPNSLNNIVEEFKSRKKLVPKIKVVEEIL